MFFSVVSDTDASTEDEDCNGDPGGAGAERRREFKPTSLKALPGCVTCDSISASSTTFPELLSSADARGGAGAFARPFLHNVAFPSPPERSAALELRRQEMPPTLQAVL